MKLIIDVHYFEDKARVAGVTFDDWLDDTETQVFISEYHGVADYKSGEFYKRELPCILKLLEEHQLEPDTIILDGYVWLDGVSKLALGSHLQQAIDFEPALIGVAKNRHSELGEDFDVLRGGSQKPLYVTAMGIDIDSAKEAIAKMHGDFRLPTLIKKADSACRGHALV